MIMSKKIYQVRLTKKTIRKLRRLPDPIGKRLGDLIDDLRDNGPIQPSWPNYSRLTDTTYHCHLSYRWVACWKRKDNSFLIEIYYAGSRENAPY